MDRNPSMRRPKTAERSKFDGTDYPAWLGFDPYKSPEEPFAFPMPSTDGDPWEHTAHLVQKHDDNMCDAWVDEIQYILIFAGLFSAIVTAFAIETQKLLQTDPVVTSVLLLAQLTNHLGVNSTPPATLSAFKDTSTPSWQPLRINLLIFISLILSLGTALVGILVLQWIRSYRKTDPLSHQDQLCVRQSRYDGLIKWKVPSLISFLPIFLQLSLVIFFAGLIDFLHTLNESLAIVIGICIGTVLLGVTFTTILPGLYILFFYQRGKPSPLPPYQSPQAWLFYRSLSFFVTSVLKRKHYRWHSWHTHPSWATLIQAYDNSLHHWLNPALLWIFRHLSDEDSFSMAYQCFKSLPDKDMAQCLVLDHMTPSHLKRLYGRLKTSCPLAAEYIPSVLLLRWDKYRRPLHQKVHLHVMELTLRCIGLDRPSKDLSTTPADPNRFLDLMYPLLVPRAGNGLQVIAEAKTCFFLTLTLMNQEQPSDGLLSPNSRSYRWYIFWTCLIRLQGYGHLDVVDDALRVLVDRITSAPQADERYRDILGKSCEGLFGSLTEKQEEKPVMEALFHQHSFLDFLDSFCNQLDFRHAIWKDALRYTDEQRRKRWDRLLFELHMDRKYWVLAHNPTSFQQLDSEGTERSSHSRSPLSDASRFLLPLMGIQRLLQPTLSPSTTLFIHDHPSAIQIRGQRDDSSQTTKSRDSSLHEDTQGTDISENPDTITIVVPQREHAETGASPAQLLLPQHHASSVHSNSTISLQSSLSPSHRTELPRASNINSIH